MTSVKQIEVFFSNSIEEYLESLISSFSKEDSPFTKRFIVTPNKYLGDWLKSELLISKKISIFMGIDIFTFIPFLHSLLKLSYGCEKKFFFPTSLDLFCEIFHLLNSEKNKKHSDLNSSSLFSTINYLSTTFKKNYFYNYLSQEQNPSFEDIFWNLFLEKNSPITNVFSHILKSFPIDHNISSISFFGFSFLPSHIINFLNSLSSHIPITSFHFSPCQEYWADDMDLDANDLSFLPFSQEKAPPLLKTIGSLSKQYQRLILDFDISPKELYKNPENNSDLNRLQKAILEYSPLNSKIIDSSICIHKAPTELRETEILFQNVWDLLKNNYIHPKDIVVLSPNLEIYQPFIQAIFSDVVPTNFILKKYDHIVSLKEKINFFFSFCKKENFADSFLQLLYLKDFQKNFFWEDYDVLEAVRLCKKTNILWSFQDFSSSKFPKELFCLLEKFPFSPYDNNYSEFNPKIIGDLCSLFLFIKNFLFHIFSNKEVSVREGFSYLKEASTRIFFTSKHEKQCLNDICDNIEIQKNLSLKLPWDIIFLLFIDEINSKYSISNSFLNDNISFLPFNSLNLSPKKYTFLLGMNAFPEKNSSFTISNTTTVPLKDDEFNQAFLEILMSTKQKLTISYVDSKSSNLLPISFVREVKSLLSEKNTFSHPLKAFSSVYFSKTSSYTKKHLHSSQFYYFDISKALSKKTSSPKNFFSIYENSKPNTFNPDDIPNNITLDLEDISSCLKHPLQYFFSSKYGLFRYKEPFDFSIPPFFFSTKKLGFLFKDFLHHKSFSENNFFPSSYKPFILDHLLEVKNAFLKQLQIKEHDIYCYCLGEEHIKNNAKNFVSKPLITLSFPKGKKVFLKGSFLKISDNKILINEPTSHSVASFPFILALMCIHSYSSCELISLSNSNNSKKNSSLFQRKHIPFIDNPNERLKQLVLYYFLSQKKPSPLLPEWIPSIFKEDEKDLKEKITKTIKNLYPNTLDYWLLNFKTLPNEKEIIFSWGNIVKIIFEGYL